MTLHLRYGRSPRLTVPDLPGPEQAKALAGQPMTVEALTIQTLDWQSFQTAASLASQAQSNRAGGVRLGRLTERWRTPR
jgi:hypothetical protein